MKEVRIVVDLQYGSTGKGLLSGVLARQYAPDTVITAWAPNAGHTYVNEEGRVWVHRMLANGIVSPNLKRIMIGPGSVIDEKVLLQELGGSLDILHDNVDLMIHESAAVVNSDDLVAEQQLVDIGSTMKGSAEAVIRKMRRRRDGTANFALKDIKLRECLVDDATWQDEFRASKSVLIEGAQGYSLSINHGFYPYTTSRNCTVNAIMNDCGLPYTENLMIYGSCRTYPIRVANRFNGAGEMIGTSGPCYFDQEEIRFEHLGIEPELTTVTKLPRRVFTFSETQIRDAIAMNMGNAARGMEVFLNFCNYCKDVEEVNELMRSITRAGGSVTRFGYGPSQASVFFSPVQDTRYYNTNNKVETLEEVIDRAPDLVTGG